MQQEHPSLGPPSVSDSGVDALVEVLQQHHVLELAAAAAQSGMSADAARALALRHPQSLRHLQGPPELLYLHPAAART